MAKLKDPALNREYPLDGNEPITLGRAHDKSNTINLPSIMEVDETIAKIPDEQKKAMLKAYRPVLEGVSKEAHLTFTNEEGSWHVAPKKDRSLYIGDKPITGKIKLENAMQLYVGERKYALIFEIQ